VTRKGKTPSPDPVTSDLIAGFDRVTVRLGLRHCGERGIIPYDACRRGDTIEIECPGCGLAVFSAKLDKTETMP
jgi:hypothetical protein